VETEGLQTGGHDILAAGIRRRQGTASDQILRECKGIGQFDGLILDDATV
jgi:hypothetical protein